jgi:hypothetical protein
MYNWERPEKVGLKRALLGLSVGAAASAGWALYFLKK